jgi:dTDP-4-dehydrorhamnose reductase
MNNVPFIGFRDVYFTPLYASDTAEIILKLATCKQIGRFHVVGTETLTKYDFAKLVARKINSDQKLIISGSIDQSSLGLKRSKNLSLSNTKLRNLGIVVPSLSEGLDKLMVEMDSIYEN